MAKYEEVPGVGIVEFPDDTPQSVLDSAKSGRIGFEEQAQQPKQTAEAQDGFSASRTAGILARGGISPATVAGGVGAAGAAAMGAPVVAGAGIAALAGGLLELGARAYNSEMAQKYGVRGEDSAKLKLPSEYLDQIKDLIGLPKAQTTGERVLEAGAETAGEALATMGAGQVLAGAKYAPKAVKALGGLLKAEPAMQVAQSASGGMAQQAAKEAGAGGVGQTIAGAGGAIAPSLPGLARAGVTSAARGFASPEAVLENIQAMRGAGTEATLGQATGAKPIQYLESALGITPGASGYMARKGAEQQAQIGSKIEQIAQELAPGATELSAGSKIRQGIKDVFLPQARKYQNTLYAEVEKYIPRNTEVDISNTKNLLNEITAPLPGMRATSESSLLKNQVIDQLTSGLNIDTALGGGLPLSGVRELRSRIGEKLGQFQMDSNFPRAELLRLYGALTEDIAKVVENAGPEAKLAFNEANAYTKRLHDKIDLLQPIIDKATPERIFNAAMGGQKADTTILGTVMDALPQDAKREFVSAFLNKMGRAVSSTQDVAGNVFSTETFLTNWDKLRGSPKEILFGNFGQSFKNDMDKIAKATSIMRTGSQQYRNPSGSGQKVVAAGTIGAGIMALFTQPAALVPMAQGAVTANLAARAMTNPKFVRLLAKKYDAPTSSLPAFISTLATQSERDNDPELKDIADGLRNQAVESDLKR
jgi:hypothetical protein